MDDGYFHGRPSATTDTDPNDPTRSGAVFTIKLPVPVTPGYLPRP
jgi:hypothetical protein